MSDMRMMSREFMSEFIEIYRQNPCLWRVKSKDYFDKKKKHAGYEKLVAKLRCVDPQATKDSVVKKINSFRSCFRKELRKVHNSIAAAAGKPDEDIYTPNLWYFEDLLFLSYQEQPAEIKTDPASPGSDASILDQTEADANEMLTDPLETAPTPSSTHIVTRADITQHLGRKKRKFDSGDKVSLLDEPEEGKYATFGKHVAEELEQLPQDMAIFCKKVINDAIFEAQMGCLSRSSHIVTEYSNC